jgi:hypothetical protein
MPKKESNYAGYPAETQKGKAEAASREFGQDYEGMRTAYETYKRPEDPKSKDMQDSLRVGNEQAAKTLRAAGDASDNERVREKNRYSSLQSSKHGTDAGEIGKKWNDTFKDK